MRPPAVKNRLLPCAFYSFATKHLQRKGGRGLLLIVISLALIGCREQAMTPDTYPFETEEKVVTLSHGPVNASLSVSPGHIIVERDNLLTLTLEAAETVEIQLPGLVDRLNGFDIAGMFSERTDLDGISTHTLYARLSPLIAEEYRIAPLVIRLTTVDGQTDWFHTPAISIPPLPSDLDKPKREITLPQPIDIPPAPIVWLAAATSVLILPVLLIVLAYNFPHIKNIFFAAARSPRSQALCAIRALTPFHPTDAAKVKTFYIQLTHIVRHYIEREYAVPATSLTTDELLSAVTRDTRFPADAMKSLKNLMYNAELIMFANHSATAEDIDKALASAFGFVEGSSIPSQ